MYAVNIVDKPNKGKLKGFWQALILIFITISIPFGLIALRLNLDFRSSANKDLNTIEPVVSNITDTSAVISFFTNIPAKATVKYGKNGQLTNSAFDLNSKSGTEEFTAHYHKLTDLEAETEYTYEITSSSGADQNEADDINSKGKFKTFPMAQNVPTPLPINGKVTGGGSFTAGIVYGHLTDGTSNSTTVSALLPASGAYSLDFGSAKKPTGEKFGGDDLVVFVSVANQGRGFIKGKLDEQFMKDIVLSADLALYDPKKTDYDPGNPVQASPTPNETSPTATPTSGGGGNPTSKPEATRPPAPTQPPPKPTAIPTPTPAPTQQVLEDLDVNNLEENTSIIQGGVLFGIGKPNTLLTLKFKENVIGSTLVGQDRTWQFSIPQNVPTGTGTLEVINEGKSLIIKNITVQKIKDLPDTAISDYTPYIPGVIVVLFGIYLLNWSQSHGKWGRGEYKETTFPDIL